MLNNWRTTVGRVFELVEVFLKHFPVHFMRSQMNILTAVLLSYLSWHILATLAATGRSTRQKQLVVTKRHHLGS